MLGIFCRLSEDVHEFAAGLDQLRKKEMTHALNENITEIYAFVLQNLEVRMYVAAGTLSHDACRCSVILTSHQVGHVNSCGSSLLLKLV